jgi:DNA-binding transcriptional ArsR family regulator
MNTETPITENQIKIARFAKALSHPIRVYIVEFLSKQACCYSGNLSDILPIAKSTLSQHLKELKDAGLIQGELETPKVRYCLDKDNWKLVQHLYKDFLQL